MKNLSKKAKETSEMFFNIGEKMDTATTLFSAFANLDYVAPIAKIGISFLEEIGHDCGHIQGKCDDVYNYLSTEQIPDYLYIDQNKVEAKFMKIKKNLNYVIGLGKSIATFDERLGEVALLGTLCAEIGLEAFNEIDMRIADQVKSVADELSKIKMQQSCEM